MNSRFTTGYFQAFILAAMAAAPVAMADVASIAAGCDGCHGANGVSEQDNMPTISGIDAFTHSEALFTYADVARPCMTVEITSGPDAGGQGNMCDIAAALSEEEIEEIADHYAALPFVPAKQPFDAALAEAGKTVHDSNCSRCHSDGGSSPDDEAGILAGQWAGYLRASFADYASGDRDQPDRMREALESLSENDIEALVNYYASQQ